MYIIYRLILLFLFLHCICDTRHLKMYDNDTLLKTLDITDEDFVDNCNYLDYETDLESLLGGKDDLNIAQINIRGLIGKQSSLIQETTPDNSTIDLYILCETWLTETNQTKINIPNYTYIGKHRSNKKGGGVGFLIHENLSYKERVDLSLTYTSELEYMFVEIKTKKANIVVGSVYRPPHTKEKHFMNDYKQLMRQIKGENIEDVILGMDHNMDLLKASKHKHTQDFLDYNLEQDLLPTITKPTRISRTCASLLDNVFLSRNLQHSFTSGILEVDLSDHLPCLVVLKDQKNSTKLQKEIKFRKINKYNIRKLDEDIKSYHWQSILSNLSTEESFTQLHKVILESFNKHMPERTRVIGQKTKNHEPWMTPGIRKSLINQRKLYRQTLKPTCNQAVIDKYKAHRKILQQVKRKAKIDFYRSRCKEFKNDTKKAVECGQQCHRKNKEEGDNHPKS